MQADAPALRFVDQPSDRSCAVGAQNDLWGLDLHLEAQRSRLEAVRLLEPVAHVNHRANLLHGRHFRKREDKPRGKCRTAFEQCCEHEIQGPQSSAPRGALQRFHPYA